MKIEPVTRIWSSCVISMMMTQNFHKWKLLLLIVYYYCDEPVGNRDISFSLRGFEVYMSVSFQIANCINIRMYVSYSDVITSHIWIKCYNGGISTYTWKKNSITISKLLFGIKASAGSDNIRLSQKIILCRRLHFSMIPKLHFSHRNFK